MSLDPYKLSRVGGSKVRTGCITCVARHLKCDEDYQPSQAGGSRKCRRCSKAGRVCQQRVHGLFAAKDVHIVQYVPRIAKGPRALPLTADAESRNAELRSLEYFRLRTAVELEGAHHSELWGYYVLQAAAAEPAIWSATVALGALHEHFEQNGSTRAGSVAGEFPFKQYGKAIQLLCESIKTGSTASQDTPLLACALFSAFEGMECHLQSALSHVTSGLRVLGEAKIKDNWGHTSRYHTTRTSLRLLFPLFTRLDTQRLQVGDSSFPSHQPLTIGRWKDLFVPLKDFHAIRFQFDNILNDMLHHIKHVQIQDSHAAPSRITTLSHEAPGLSHVVEAYLLWTNTFDTLLHAMLSPEDIPSCLLLQSWRILVNCMLRYDLKEGEMGFDPFQPDFESIAGLAAEAVCWSIHHSGPSGSLSTLPTSSPLDGKLPDKLRQRHVAGADTRDEAQQSGFMGVCLSRHAYALRQEAKKSAESTQHLLERSVLARTHNHQWTSARDDTALTIKPTFTFSHGVVYPLYVIVSRCRYPHTRRKAWSLLYRCNRREGLWDSPLAARLGQRIIQIEESQALESMTSRADHSASAGVPTICSASQIPNWARVRLVRSTFLPDSKSINRFYFGWSGTFEDARSREEVWVEEMVER